jgi:hypothetical protein
MGKVKGFAQEFLEKVGYDMGYDMSNLPSMAEMEDLMNQPPEPSDDELREIEAVSLFENGDIDNFDFMEGLS